MMIICYHPPWHITGGVFDGLEYLHKSESCCFIWKQTVKAIGICGAGYEEGRTWVLLASGSKTFRDYRHQSDIYRAYHFLRDGGISDKHIVVFHYDDLANDQMNPFPGQVRHDRHGPDVYPGVPKDYTGRDLTSSNLYDALLGNPTDKKVISSNSHDRIFVFFLDMGSKEEAFLCQ